MSTLGSQGWSWPIAREKQVATSAKMVREETFLFILGLLGCVFPSIDGLKIVKATVVLSRNPQRVLHMRELCDVVNGSRTQKIVFISGFLIERVLKQHIISSSSTIVPFSTILVVGLPSIVLEKLGDSSPSHLIGKLYPSSSTRGVVHNRPP